MMAGQQPIVLSDFTSETECRQVVEDVLKQVPKKPRGPKRQGFCIPMTATQIGEDPASE
jgi:hypothetical protein